jgi:hypothetical protein
MYRCPEANGNSHEVESNFTLLQTAIEHQNQTILNSLTGNE